MTHATTNMLHFARTAPLPNWHQRAAFLDAPQFYLDQSSNRSIGIEELLPEAIPFAQRHVTAALQVVESAARIALTRQRP
jgi:hypothetical protein